jgi:hypothetical protein
MPIRCDNTGNAYFRVYESAASRPIARIASDGKASIIRLPRDYSPDDVEDYAPTRTGVDVLVRLPKNEQPTYRVLRFSGDGSFLSETTIRPGFIAGQLGLFDSGDYLVAGYEDRPPKGVAAIFDSRGTLLKNVSLEGDLKNAEVNKNEPKPARDKDEKEAEEESYLRAALQTSTIAGPSDGELFLARNSVHGPVFAIASTGTVRRIRLPLPREDARLVQVKASHGQLVAQYFLSRDPKQPKVLPMAIEVLDGQSGDKLQSISIRDVDTGFAFVCYEPSQYTFLKAKAGGKLDLVQARPN